MNLSQLLRRSVREVMLLALFSGCLMMVTPRAMRAWDRHLSQSALTACQRQGGVPLIGPDSVVSCAPPSATKVGWP